MCLKPTIGMSVKVTAPWSWSRADQLRTDPPAPIPSYGRICLTGIRSRTLL
ncbi:hypothetical protein SPURM210S_06446 [Streptomyces purpurascens]